MYIKNLLITFWIDLLVSHTKIKRNYSRDENVMIIRIISIMNKRENMRGKDRIEMKKDLE